ncbi:hypothetical protein AX16_008621 [Volvariella volvacea WC 439]|nr:hypothetical protein AX16_008621 [Volvariella volvacea WC 439]
MPSVWQRHPKYSLLIAFTILATLYLLSPYSDGSGISLTGLGSLGGRDLTLAARLERADRIYDKVLRDRQKLIQKWGPEPKDIYTFPPDVRPWPPYTVWDFFPAAYNCPHEVERHGAMGDGGKWVCGLSRLREKRDCIIYSFGINLESSFEASILENTNHCQIWGYDFSVPSFGPEISHNYTDRAHFFAYGLAGTNHKDPEGHPMYTLQSLMEHNNHDHIDILKIDIEGWEFEALEAFVKPYLKAQGPGGKAGRALPVGQLQLEIHIWDKTFEWFLGWWEMLESVGLRPFWTEPNLVYQNYHHDKNSDLAEYSFINIQSPNAFISDSAMH